MEVDIQPEDLLCHGTLKAKIIRSLRQQVKLGALGHLFTDAIPVCCPL